MTWNVNFIGKPENVVEALIAHSLILTGQSKIEYDEIYHSITTLISNNIDNNNGIVIKLVANGHANIINGVKTYGTCTVNIEPFYTTLV